MKQQSERRPAVKVGVRAHARKIEKVYLAITERVDGEGVYTLVGPESEMIPIVAVHESDLHVLEEYARGQAQLTRQTVSIICFTRRSHHETFRPVTTGDDE